jgi:hypothetical protein
MRMIVEASLNRPWPKFPFSEPDSHLRTLGLAASFFEHSFAGRQ